MEVRKLKDGEYAWAYFNNSKTSDRKHLKNKITVDKNGFQHSINDEPGYIGYYDYGDNVFVEHWFKHGYRHRLTGPAYINHAINSKEYWIEGKQFTQQQYETERNRIQILNQI